MEENFHRVLKVSVSFPDGKKYEYEIDASSTVKDLMALINKNPAISQPPETTLSMIYQGKIILPNDVLGKLESMDEFTVLCFFRKIKLDESQKADDLQRMNSGNCEESIERSRSSVMSLHGIDAQIDEELDIDGEFFPALFSDGLPLDPILDSINDMPIDIPPEPRMRRELLFNISISLLLLGFLLGYYLGAGAFMFALLTFRNKRLMLGILVGSCIHYLSVDMRH